MQLRLRRNLRTYSSRHNMILVPISVPRMTLLSSATGSNWIIRSPSQAPIEPALQCCVLSLARMSFDFRMAPHATSPCTSAPRSWIISFCRSISRKWTLQTVSSMGIASLISQDVVGFSFRVRTRMMPPSSTCRNATTCTLLLVPLPSLPDPSFIGSPRSHPGPTQLSALVKHSTGLPAHLTAGLHPMHSCQACNDGKIQRAPMGTTSDTAPIVSATRFHLDFGFIRASSHYFGVTKGPRVVTSYDGNNTYLIIVDSKQRYSWFFCQPSKSPLVSILERFLAVHGFKEGPRSLRMDQGGELLGSDQLRDFAHAYGYVIEPTGSDSAWHGRLAKLNVSMVRLASWFDASFVVLACQPNSGPLPSYTQYISRTGCNTRQLERRLMKDGQVSSPSWITYGLLAPLLRRVSPENVQRRLTDTLRMVSSLGLGHPPNMCVTLT
jgi:hypothetical protein